MCAGLMNRQSWNRYAYALNNPLMYVDPTGMDQCVWDDGTFDDPVEDGGVDQQECGDQGGTWYVGPTLGVPAGVIVINVNELGTNPIFDGNNGSSVNLGGPILPGGSIGGGRNCQIPFPCNAANNGRVPNNITCSTVLPSGRTVGSYVQAVSNQINGSTSTTSTPYGPVAQYNGGPSPLSVVSFVYSSINFKIMFQGQANAAFLGDAGNFAYGAVSANIGVPLWAAEAVAGGYALLAGHQDANGPFWMDQSASQQVQPGYSAQCK
jgi:hypothetical protein